MELYIPRECLSVYEGGHIQRIEMFTKIQN